MTGRDPTSRIGSTVDPEGPMVVTDLDGSLWDHELRCHPGTIAALGELRGRGVPVLAATGRRANSARTGLAANGLVLPAVLLNGAIGVDFRTEDLFHDHPFVPDEVVEVVSSLGAVGCAAVMYLLDGTTTGPRDVTTGDAHRVLLRPDYVVADPVEVARSRSVMGFSMIGLPRNRIAHVEEAISPSVADVLVYHDHLYSARAGEERWSVHIQPVGVSKMNGIEAFLTHAGLAPSSVIAVGDGSNDVEMLLGADVGLGVAGGHIEALDVADHVIPPPEVGGWEKVLDHI